MDTKINIEAQVEYFSNKGKYEKYNIAENKPVTYISLEDVEITETLSNRNQNKNKAIVITRPSKHMDLVRVLLHKTSRINVNTC